MKQIKGTVQLVASVPVEVVLDLCPTFIMGTFPHIMLGRHERRRDFNTNFFSDFLYGSTNFEELFLHVSASFCKVQIEMVICLRVTRLMVARVLWAVVHAARNVSNHGADGGCLGDEDATNSCSGANDVPKRGAPSICSGNCDAAKDVRAYSGCSGDSDADAAHNV